MRRVGIAMATAVMLLAATAGADAAETAPAFSLPTALFVTARAPIYGMYEARLSHHYKAGETIHFYVEPRDYGYRPVGELSEFGMTADLLVIQDGKVIVKRDGFLKADLKSHHQNKEFMMNGTVSFDGAPPGNYTMELVLHDMVSGQTAKADLPFTIDK